jgi:ABC-2 type transport system permease protein
MSLSVSRGVNYVTSTSLTAGPSLRSIIASLLRADFAVLLRNRNSLILSCLLPLILLVVTGSRGATHYLGGSLFIIGLSITYGLASTSIMGYTVTAARDRERGVFQRLRVTPAPKWTIMTSRLAIQMVANLIIALVAVVIGSQIHHLGLSAAQYVLVLAVSLLGGAVFLSLGQAVVGLLSSAETVQAIARTLYMVLIFLGLWGQSGQLGGGLESFARWTPVGTVITVFAGVLSPAAWTSTDSLSLLACGGYIVFFAAIGIRWFKWDAR